MTGSSPPNVSVLLPCHNGSVWLVDAVRSVLTQTFSDIELLIYDDGSTDASWPLIERLAASDRRVIPIRGTPNRGIVHALTTMLNRARGRFIARMDADDICLPMRFEQQLAFLDQQKIDLCGSWFQEFGGGLPRRVRWPHRSEELEAAMLFQNTICHPTIMARREVFEAVAYRDANILAEDYDLFVRAGQQFRLANVPQVLLRYRRHPQQATQAKRSLMEQVTKRIRLQALEARGIFASAEEQRIHNIIRAPESITSLQEMDDIEGWLLKLAAQFDDAQARAVVASQWTRAAVRAAPLGHAMLRRYAQSPLRGMMPHRWAEGIDLALLATVRLDYQSPAFNWLRRLGLSG
ncbi:MAG: glycosyltransferase family 2 protein [Burkholderiaceae bacterium]